MNLKVLKESVDEPRPRPGGASMFEQYDRWPTRAITTTLRVARFGVQKLLREPAEPSPKLSIAKGVVLKRMCELVAGRWTCGYRQAMAWLSCEFASEDKPCVICSYVYQIMKQHTLPAPQTAERLGREHDGKVIVMGSNL